MGQEDYYSGYSEVLRRIKNSKSATIQTRISMQKELQFHGKLSHNFPVDRTAFAYPMDSEFEGFFSYQIRRMSETGQLHKIYQNWGIVQPEPLQLRRADEGQTPFAIEAKNVVFVFMVLAAGSILSFIVLLIEKGICVSFK